MDALRPPALFARLSRITGFACLVIVGFNAPTLAQSTSGGRTSDPYLDTPMSSSSGQSQGDPNIGTGRLTPDARGDTLNPDAPQYDPVTGARLPPPRRVRRTDPAVPDGPRNMYGDVAAPPVRPTKPGITADYHLTPAPGDSRRRTQKYDPRSTYSGRPAQKRPTLPPLEPYATRARPAPAQIDPSPYQPAPNVAVVPTIKAKPKRAVDDSPFAPLGIDVGSLRLTPYVEVDAGYASNPAKANVGVKGSALERIEVGTAIQSLWSVHDLSGTLEAGYTRFNAVPTQDTPDAKANLLFRGDVSRALALDATLRASYTTQQPGTPGLPSSLTSPPPTTSVGTTLGATYHPGPLSLGLHGVVDRSDYSDGTLIGGGTSRLSDQNNVDYGLEAKAGYEIRPGIQPFIEAKVDNRVHERSVDQLGYRRDSTGASVAIGSSFELTRLLTGSVSAGYLERNYADSRFAKLRGPLIDASLVWSATALTTVTLGAQTTQAETTILGASGALANKVTLGVKHALFRNLTLGAEGSVQQTDYAGISQRDTTTSAKLTLDYSLSRSVVIRGSFTHERLSSTASANDYTANVFLVGLRLQR